MSFTSLDSLIHEINKKAYLRMNFNSFPKNHSKYPKLNSISPSTFHPLFELDTRKVEFEKDIKLNERNPKINT